MLKFSSVGVLRSRISWTLIVVLSCALTLPAQSPAQTAAPDNVKSSQSRPVATHRGTAEQRTANYFESIRKSPPQQLAFLLKMPKGADLHNHLSGAIYAESYIDWAAEKGLCVNNRTMALSVPASPSKCDSDQTAANTALTNSILYRQLIDAWSMRNWQLSGQSGHDHFFDAFGR